jgi:hypothetical protein
VAEGVVRPLWQLVAAAVAVVLGGRAVIVVAMALVTTGMDEAMELVPWPKTQLVLWLLVSWVGWRWIADAAPSSRRRGLTLIAALTVAWAGGRLWWLSRPDAPLWRPLGAPREVGVFPYQAGSVVQYMTLDGFLATATVGPDGTRVCGPPVDPTGRVIVATIGDSFVFGLGANDGGAMCDLLRARLDTDRPGVAKVINLGQPGANIGTYAENVRYAVNALGARVVVVGLTIPDDLNPIDVNDPPWLREHLWFRLLLATFDPEVTLQFLSHSQELVLPEVAANAFAWESLAELRDVADELDVPVGVFIFGDPYLNATWHSRSLQALDATSERLTFLGEIHPPEGMMTFHQRDMHPTALGNVYFAEGTVPWVLDRVDAAGAR